MNAPAAWSGRTRSGQGRGVVLLLALVPQGKRTDRALQAIAAPHGAEAVDVAWEEKKAAK